jgi:serine phosphatase RsbU (regulator of sigma subunit)
VEWAKSKPEYNPETETHYREAKRSEQLRVAENLQELYTTAGVLVVDAQGHGIISAKIASTVHDTFHALMLAELDWRGSTTPELFERVNLRLAQSVSARNTLGRSEKENAREIATMLYGEIHPKGYFRFVNFGHPPPLVFSAEYGRFMKILREHMVQFLPLGLQIPDDDPDRNRYFSMEPRNRRLHASDIAELTLMSPGDILFLYTDGVYDGYDEQEQKQLEDVIRQHYKQSAKDLCNALLERAVRQDDIRRRDGDVDLIDDKTVFIIKRT